MTTVLNLLETLGSNATYTDAEKFEQLLAEVELGDELKSAIKNGDKDVIAASLQARTKVFCGIVPAEDDEPSEDDQENDNNILSIANA